MLELESLERAVQYSVPRGKGRGVGNGDGKYVTSARERVETRVEFMEGMLERWFL